MERTRILTGTLVATFLYFTSFGVEAKVFSCWMTKGNPTYLFKFFGNIPNNFMIDLSNDREVANIMGTTAFQTKPFGEQRFEKSVFGSSLWLSGKRRKKHKDYDYQLKLDLDPNDTQAKVAMMIEGYPDRKLWFRCVAVGSDQLVVDPRSTRPAQVSKLANDSLVSAIAAMENQDICENATHLVDNKLQWREKAAFYYNLQEAKTRGLTCGVNASVNLQIDGKYTDGLQTRSDELICREATDKDPPQWKTNSHYRKFVQEAKRRGLLCGVGKTTQSVAQIETIRNFTNISDAEICRSATKSEGNNKVWNDSVVYFYMVEEAKLRGLSCGLSDPPPVIRGDEYNLHRYGTASTDARDMNDSVLCTVATKNTLWDSRDNYAKFVNEAKRRGLGCGVTSGSQIAKAPIEGESKIITEEIKRSRQNDLASITTFYGDRTNVKADLSIDLNSSELRIQKKSNGKFRDAVLRAIKGLPIKVGFALYPNQKCSDAVEAHLFETKTLIARVSGDEIVLPLDEFHWQVLTDWRGDFGFVLYPDPAIDSWTCSDFNLRKYPVAASVVAQLSKISGENYKDSKGSKGSSEVGETTEVRALRERLATLEAEKNAKQQLISQDTEKPSLRITSFNSDGPSGTISGVTSDNTGIAEVLVGGRPVVIDPSGQFSASVFVPSDGIDVEVSTYDLNGLATTEIVRLERTKRTQQVSRLAAVNPLLGPKQKPSRDRAALIIGVEKYARAPSADYASGDAQMFADYAREKLGVADNNIKILTDTGASEAEILRALKVWLPKAVKPDTTDLYVFYAGHGMPTADGTSAYLVPYDGDIQLLEDTAISRKRFFDEISATKPRSATFFFDNCFSGATRSEELLLASRPLGIKVQETSIPDNYLVFAAGETDQIAGVEPEVKHGRFSYFVFKGLEGEADANRDGKISAGELHKYVRESVGRFSAGAQTPTMLGDAGRWVVR